jgi:thymidylate synthase
MLPLFTLRTGQIRDLFKTLLAENQFTTVNREGSMTNLVGSTTIEIVGASFIADEDSIFGDVNWDYVRREEEWYNSMSLNVNDIPGGPPQIWKAVSDRDGFINSNYGWCIYHPDNFNQYQQALAELQQNPGSRRATMIYTRPSMWLDYNKNGRSDFMCTSTVQYLIRNDRLHAVVQMRSNDALFGFRNDRAWQQHVLEKLAGDLCIESGKLYWQVGSLHVYERHYYLVDPVNYKKP